jgi:ribosomal protein L4
MIVSKKTKELILSSRNIKNLELISASSLNTMSIIKSKHILLTVPALNDIKEIYCD